MLAVFALRLAIGMLACLLLLPRKQVHPRFYRTHFLIVLALGVLAIAFGWDHATPAIFALLGVGVALAFIGSIVWSIEGAPGGLGLAVVATAALGAALCLLQQTKPSDGTTPGDITLQIARGNPTPSMADVFAADITSAAILGAAISAMLMGHSYLIAPGMSLVPLLRLIGAAVLGVLARGAVDGYALWCWTAAHPSIKLGNDLLLWLPLRWAAGFLLPLILLWMAWQSARIRSTQSATGILYVEVIFCFLGELTDQLLRDSGVTF
jgi:hypothetical protein